MQARPKLALIALACDMGPASDSASLLRVCGQTIQLSVGRSFYSAWYFIGV